MTCALAYSFAPKSIRDAMAVWTAHGGQNDGIVGGQSHVSQYHLGKPRIMAKAPGPWAGQKNGICVPGQGWADPSVQTARDKAGLSSAASAADFGQINGVVGSEVPFAKWLIAECQKSAPDTLDIRAVNYETMRWDRERGVTSPAYDHGLDESGHDHVEWFRDSEFHDHAAVVARYFGTTGGGNQPGDEMGLSTRILDRIDGTFTFVGAGHALIVVSSAAFVTAPAGQVREVAAKAVLTAPVPGHEKIVAGTEGYLVGNVRGLVPDTSELAFVLASDGTFAPTAVIPDYPAIPPGTYTVK